MPIFGRPLFGNDNDWDIDDRDMDEPERFIPLEGWPTQIYAYRYPPAYTYNYDPQEAPYGDTPEDQETPAPTDETKENPSRA